MSVYEKHLMADPRLPFIYHSFTGGKRDVMKDVGNWHENIELLCFTDGSATVTSNELSIEVRAGDIAVINTNCIHDIFAHEKTHYYCLIVDRAFCTANHFDTNYVTFEPLVRDGRLVELIREFAEEYENTQQPYRVQSLRAIVLKIMTLLCRGYSTSSSTPHTDTPLLSSIKLALGYINSGSHNRLTLDGIAEAAGISKYYLAREFRRITGYTVVAYINRVRCDRAAKLLAEGTLKVEAVARSCGFLNLSYFTRTFKRTTGMLPSRYRSKYAKRCDLEE